MFDLAGKTVFVAGHRGMVGQALVRRLRSEDCAVLTADRGVLDLENGGQVDDFLAARRPDAIVIAAARVGGILANQRFPASFLATNLAIANNIMGAAHRCGVDRLLFLGSSCIYPKHASQPISEDSLLTGPLEPTNLAYAVAKIAGVTLVQSMRTEHGRDYISAMPTNLYGPGDTFDLDSGHVLPALLRKAHEAIVAGASHVTVWGTGTPRREFLHVDDCADALVLLLKTYSGPKPVNVGFGSDVTIAELAEIICTTTGFAGEIAFDLTKPDGTPRKLLDSTTLGALGWRPSIGLEMGIAQTYAWFLSHMDKARAA